MAITDQIIGGLKGLDEGGDKWPGFKEYHHNIAPDDNAFSQAMISNFTDKDAEGNSIWKEIPESLGNTYEDYSMVDFHINELMKNDPDFLNNPEFQKFRVYQDKLAHDLNAEMKLHDPYSKIPFGESGNQRRDYSYSIQWGEADETIRSSFESDIETLRSSSPYWQKTNPEKYMGTSGDDGGIIETIKSGVGSVMDFLNPLD